MIYIYPKYNWLLREKDIINIENIRRGGSFGYDKIDKYESSMYDVRTERGFRIMIGQQARFKIFKDGEEKYEWLYKLKKDDTVILYKSQYNGERPTIDAYRQAIKLFASLFCDKTLKRYLLKDYKVYRRESLSYFNIPQHLPYFLMKTIVSKKDLYYYAFLQVLRKYYWKSEEALNGIFSLEFNGSEIALELNLLCLKLGIFSYVESLSKSSHVLIIDSNSSNFVYKDKIKSITRKKYIKDKHQKRQIKLISVWHENNINGFDVW